MEINSIIQQVKCADTISLYVRSQNIKICVARFCRITCQSSWQFLK